MRISTATEVPVDHTVTKLPLAVRQRISAIVADGGQIHEVVELDPDTFAIHRTLPVRRHEIVRL